VGVFISLFFLLSWKSSCCSCCIFNSCCSWSRCCNCIFYFRFIPAGPPAFDLGVTGRPAPNPWYWYFAFFSLGFKIWNEKWKLCYNEKVLNKSFDAHNVIQEHSFKLELSSPTFRLLHDRALAVLLSKYLSMESFKIKIVSM